MLKWKKSLCIAYYVWRVAEPTTPQEIPNGSRKKQSLTPGKRRKTRKNSAGLDAFPIFAVSKGSSNSPPNANRYDRQMIRQPT
jgi:hypothetical protein